MTLEGADEMAQVGKAALEAGFGHGCAVEEPAGCLIQTNAQQVAMGRSSRQFREDAREVKGAHAYGSGESTERVIVFIAILHGFLGGIDALRVPGELTLAEHLSRRPRFLADCIQ